MLKYLPAHIANYFLWKAEEDSIEDMTPIKLITIVYFGYAWVLAVLDKNLFYEKVEAWRYGPVISSIYHEFKSFETSPICQYAMNFSMGTGEKSYPIISDKDSETLEVLSAVWEVYKDRSGLDLSSITHEQGTPWRDAYDQGENTPMDNEKIKTRAREAILKYQ